MYEAFNKCTTITVTKLDYNYPFFSQPPFQYAAHWCQSFISGSFLHFTSFIDFEFGKCWVGIRRPVIQARIKWGRTGSNLIRPQGLNLTESFLPSRVLNRNEGTYLCPTIGSYWMSSGGQQVYRQSRSSHKANYDPWVLFTTLYRVFSIWEAKWGLCS